MLTDIIRQIEYGRFDIPSPSEVAAGGYPTVDAYEAACKALWKWRDEATRLQAADIRYREALGRINILLEGDEDSGDTDVEECRRIIRDALAPNEQKEDTEQ